MDVHLYAQKAFVHQLLRLVVSRLALHRCEQRCPADEDNRARSFIAVLVVSCVIVYAKRALCAGQGVQEIVEILWFAVLLPLGKRRVVLVLTG